MDKNIKLIAERIETMRDIMEISPEEMAQALGMTAEEYLEYETGEKDFAFSFLYTVANKLGVDITDLLTGESPRLSLFSCVRAGEGLAMERRKEYKYQHLAFFFKNKKAEPFHVTVAPGDNTEMHLNSHEGQEFDYVLKGSMRIRVDAQEAVVSAGDAVYYDSSRSHGMVCEGEEPCEFLAIIMK